MIITIHLTDTGPVTSPDTEPRFMEVMVTYLATLLTDVLVIRVLIRIMGSMSIVISTWTAVADGAETPGQKGTSGANTMKVGKNMAGQVAMNMADRRWPYLHLRILLMGLALKLLNPNFD